MNFPPIFTAVSGTTDCTALLGSSPVRFYPFGNAPEKGTGYYDLPYAVYQTIGGEPENYLKTTPDADQYLIQVDIYAESISDARDTALAVVAAVQQDCYVTRYSNEAKDYETGLYRVTLDCSWIVKR